MANYNKEIDGDTVVNTLVFMNQVFEEKIKDSGAFCPITIEAQVDSEFPDLPTDIFTLIQKFESFDDADKLDAIDKLYNYERKMAGELNE